MVIFSHCSQAPLSTCSCLLLFVFLNLQPLMSFVYMLIWLCCDGGHLYLLAVGPGSSKDWEEKAEELQARVWELEKQNANLKGKVRTNWNQHSSWLTKYCNVWVCKILISLVAQYSVNSMHSNEIFVCGCKWYYTNSHKILIDGVTKHKEWSNFVPD